MKGEKWSAGQLRRVNVFGDAAVLAEIKKKKKTSDDLYFGLYLQGIKALQADSVGGKLETLLQRAVFLAKERIKKLPNC